jgi:hypothetical protein
MLKTVKRKVVRLFLALSLFVLLVGAPATPPSLAGSCVPATGSNCPPGD